MRWAEGREILERKIIWQGKMGGQGEVEYVGEELKQDRRLTRGR